MNLSTYNIKHMKSITLFLLFAVIIYGIQSSDFHNSTIAIASYKSDELPIYSVDTDKPWISLTFDSAWGDEDLDTILSILKKHNAPATFFVTGEWAQKYPDAILKIHKNGHEIGNHGNAHKHMPQISAEEMKQEIENCHNAVYKITGTHMNLFRAPYSDWNKDVISIAHSMGYSSINHSVDSLDWKDYGIDSIIRTVCEHKNLENGSIILLHNGATYTKDALDTLLCNLEEQGYSFVKVSNLIYTDNYYFDHTGKQFLNKNETNEHTR